LPPGTPGKRARPGKGKANMAKRGVSKKLKAKEAAKKRLAKSGEATAVAELRRVKGLIAERAVAPVFPGVAPCSQFTCVFWEKGGGGGSRSALAMLCLDIMCRTSPNAMFFFVIIIIIICGCALCGVGCASAQAPPCSSSGTRPPSGPSFRWRKPRRRP
jgi:hypothetical protein